MTAWTRCTACKRDIAFGAVYWVCSVSTCTRRNTDYTFCSVACWDSHVATLRHRDAWAVEATAPTREAWQREQDGGPRTASAPAAPARAAAPSPSVAPMVRPASSSSTPMLRPASSSSTPMLRPAGASSTTPPVPVPRPDQADGHRRVVPAPTPPPAPSQLSLAEAEQEVLIVVSKLKKYIRDRSGMNTSDSIVDGLSDHVRAICDEAIRNAALDERKTVLDRDIPRLPRR